MCEAATPPATAEGGINGEGGLGAHMGIFF